MTSKTDQQQPRVLHSAALLRPPSGILNQMQWEQEAAQTLGIPWTTVMYCPDNATSPNKITHFDHNINSQPATSPFKKLRHWIQLRRNYHQWLRSQVNNYDIFLLRYYVHDPYQWNFVKNFPKPVYFVHHTLEVPELAMPKTIGSFIRAGLDAWIGKYTLSHAAGLIGVTEEILEYEKKRTSKEIKKTITYPNGVNYHGFHTKLIDKRTTETPEILFVASGFADWHGLDLLVEAVKKSEQNFVLHVVGSISLSIQNNIASDSRIIPYGILSHSQIVEISKKCWVGLSSFALHRNNMKQACTLKVREYLMMGLPVYCSYQDIFPESFPYFRNDACDMRKILDFAALMRNVEKFTISEKSKPHIDKKLILKKIYQNLKNQFNEN